MICCGSGIILVSTMSGNYRLSIKRKTCCSCDCCVCCCLCIIVWKLYCSKLISIVIDLGVYEAELLIKSSCVESEPSQKLLNFLIRGISIFRSVECSLLQVLSHLSVFFDIFISGLFLIFCTMKILFWWNFLCIESFPACLKALVHPSYGHLNGF